MKAISLENAKANIGAYFTMHGVKYLVTQVDHFSGVMHYGFTIEASPKNLALGANDNAPYCGWIPVAFIGQCEF